MSKIKTETTPLDYNAGSDFGTLGELISSVRNLPLNEEWQDRVRRSSEAWERVRKGYYELRHAEVARVQGN